MDSTSSAPDAETPPAPIVFRGKKRKTYRQRASADDPDQAQTKPESARTIDPTPDTAINTQASVPGSSALVTKTTDDDEEEEEGEGALSVAEALRLRNARKSRLRRGVVFGPDQNGAKSEGPEEADDELSLMIREEEKKVMAQSVAAANNKRFAPQTGLSGEVVNRHMEEYIEAELAKRHSLASGSQKQQSSSQSAGTGTAIDLNQAKHTALTGKLFEVDLGEEVRSRNEALTDRARRKLQGLAVDDEEEAQRSKRVRLGRDGKPWRPRNRRDSDAIKRDQLVEEILRENKLDVYEAPTPPPAANAAEEEAGAADDRIAEEFRREFLDAMAERQRRRRQPAPPAKPGAKKEEEGLKGPKLGGSRNTRAAYRDLLLQKEKEAKK